MMLYEAIPEGRPEQCFLQSPNVELTGRRSAQRGGKPTAQLLGVTVERSVKARIG